MSGDIEATIAECSICLNSVLVQVVLSKRALKDLSIYCTFNFFSFYLLVMLFTLPELIGLVDKDLHKTSTKRTLIQAGSLLPSSRQCNIVSACAKAGDRHSNFDDVVGA